MVKNRSNPDFGLGCRTPRTISTDQPGENTEKQDMDAEILVSCKRNPGLPIRQTEPGENRRTGLGPEIPGDCPEIAGDGPEI